MIVFAYINYITGAILLDRSHSGAIFLYLNGCICVYAYIDVEILYIYIYIYDIQGIKKLLLIDLFYNYCITHLNYLCLDFVAEYGIFKEINAWFTHSSALCLPMC